MRELDKIKVNGHWHQVYLTCFDVERKENYYTVRYIDDSYVDIPESQVQEKEYADYD